MCGREVPTRFVSVFADKLTCDDCKLMNLALEDQRQRIAKANKEMRREAKRAFTAEEIGAVEYDQITRSVLDRKIFETFEDQEPD